MKVFVTGSSGLLGSNASSLLAKNHKITASFFKHHVRIPECTMVKLDVRNPREVKEILKAHQPDIILHCAADANVDHCEDHPQDAYELNVSATQNLIQEAAQLGAKMIYISTDSVFTENRRAPFKESDPTNPKNVYAKTKLEAEKLMLDMLSNGLIIRTCIYGFNALPKQSLGEWIIFHLEKGESINGFTDVYFSPILVNDLTSAIEAAISKNLSGIYHIASRDQASKYDFAKMIASKFGYPETLIKPSRVQSANLRAFRPSSPCLDVSKFETASTRTLPTIYESVENFYQLKKRGYHQQLKSFLVQQLPSL